MVRLYIYIYTYKQVLVLNNVQGLLCYKTQPNTIAGVGRIVVLKTFPIGLAL